MSTAAGSFQCVWVGDNLSFTASLIGSQGDIFQRYSGDPLTTSEITPNFAVDKPYLRVILLESDPNITENTLAGYVSDNLTKWYVDGKEILFNDNGISIDGTTDNELSGYGGCFRKLTSKAGPNYKAEAPFGGLEIINNLVKPSNGLNITISVIVAINAEGKPTYVQGTAPVRMVKSVGTSNFCTIYCGSGESFVLAKKGNSVTCKVRCWQGETELQSSAFYRKWYLLESGAWVQKATTADFKVDTEDIATFGEVKVECYSDSARTKLIASDIQTVNDASDPLILSPNPSPADGKFYANKEQDVSFTPKVTDADGSEITVNGFKFAVMDSVGNMLNSDNTQLKTSGTPYVVPWDTANGVKDNILVVITAEG